MFALGALRTEAVPQTAIMKSAETEEFRGSWPRWAHLEQQPLRLELAAALRWQCWWTAEGLVWTSMRAAILGGPTISWPLLPESPPTFHGKDSGGIPWWLWTGQKCHPWETYRAFLRSQASLISESVLPDTSQFSWHCPSVEWLLDGWTFGWMGEWMDDMGSMTSGKW